jgi:prefoldin subunit 5
MINNLTASVNRALQDLSQGMAYLQQYLTTWINNRVAEVVALLNAFQVWVIASIKDAQVALTKLNVDLVSLATKTTKEIADRAAAITKLQKDLQKWTTDQVLILLLQALDKAVGA